MQVAAGPVGGTSPAPVRRPRLSIGLPVHNGERYLQAAIDSVLAQDFEDFELLIGDNGSTDATPAICREAAAKDERVIVHRSDVNRGAAWNFNRLVDLARGEYFKWAAHDDLLAPEFLRRCVEVLDERADVSLVYPCSARIDERGAVTHQYGRVARATSDRSAQRAASVLRPSACLEVFGLMRRDQLLATEKIGPYTSSDRTLLLELALRGQFYTVPEVLFFHREHPDRSMRLFPDARSRNIWFDPMWTGKKRATPQWRLLREYVLAVTRSSLPPSERAHVMVFVLLWAVRARHRLVQEVGGLIGVPTSRRTRSRSAPGTTARPA